MGRVICVCNQKGGVGKTTTSVNLASCLALSEKKTLLIDMDPQANASSGLGVRLLGNEKSIYELILGNIRFDESVRATELNYLEIVPSSQDLIGAEIEFVGLADREGMLLKALEGVRLGYDFIIIDCPPSLGFLTLNSLVAADSVLIPIQCEYYALEGVGRLLHTIQRIKANYNSRLEIEGFLLTMFDPRNNLSRQVVENVRQNLTRVFDTIIPRNVRLSESPSFGKPVVLYDITSRGAAGYLALTKEILNGTNDGDIEKAYSVRAGS
jgi:chromosome partitioning protein